MFLAAFLALALVPQTPHVTTWAGEEVAASVNEAGRLSIQAPIPARAVGVWWEGELHATLLLDGEAFPSPILPAPDLDPDHAGATGPAGRCRVSGLFHGHGRKLREVTLEFARVHGLRRFHLVWIPWFANPDAQSEPEPVFGPANYPPPPIYDRASWGADPPQCSSGTCAVTHIALHHTANASEYSSPDWATSAGNVRAIQDYHMFTRGWCDIGYHYLIDVHGHIFEGRAGDDVRGAHDGHNCGSVGVAMMGYFHSPHHQSLSPAMQDSYAELAAWKCDQKSIDPLGSGWYSGYGGVMDHLYGHRDVGATACPGDLAYAQLPALRQAVDDRLTGGGGAIVLDTDALTLIGTWNLGSSASGKFGSDYRWASTGTAAATAYWQPHVPQGRRYAIQIWYPAGSNRAPAALHGVIIHGKLYTGTVDQRVQGGQWLELGETFLPSGNATQIGLNNSGPGGSVVIADALRLVPR